ncbi:37S ribosomal protein Rsm22 [Ophiocordyceps sinensis CO18]|uniref:37S ribosomal protein Rsm22 n=1 Tax=Ophiocordyceps sinensis (strain Co18 / CGMCC 3.14243) TaxID=911162 RepID=T4ZWY1_OPHSC|nr:37S ribosomal protein Rsm22 [Ophiocordyceps sinensis CO18]
MLALKRLQGARPGTSCTCPLFLRRRTSYASPALAQLASSSSRVLQRSSGTRGRSFTSSAYFRVDLPTWDEARSREEIEEVVREAEQRWRGTLPKDYLTPREYALYVRLYGPPLRETEPEDVGIPTHADMGGPASPPEESQTLVEGGLEEVKHETKDDQDSQDQGDASAEGAAVEAMDQTPRYVDAVARNSREHAALLKLSQDFEAAQRKQREREQSSAIQSSAVQEGDEVDDQDPADEWPEEDENEDDDGDYRAEERRRFHRHTLAGHFNDGTVEVMLSGDRLGSSRRGFWRPRAANLTDDAHKSEEGQDGRGWASS